MSTGAGEGKGNPKVGNSMHKGTEGKGKTQSACACVHAFVRARACVLLLEIRLERLGIEQWRASNANLRNLLSGSGSLP